MPETSFFDWIQIPTFLNTLSSFLADFPSFITRKLNSSLSALTTSNSHLIRMQSFIQNILTNLLQLKKDSPFSTHPTTMRVATIVFYTALRFSPRRRFKMIADYCLLSIGNASVASLSSVLLPASLSPFVFAVLGLQSAAELMYWLYHEFVSENNIWTAFSNLTGQMQPILPL